MLDAGLTMVAFPATVGARAEGVEVMLDAGLTIVVFSEETSSISSVIILLSSPWLDADPSDGGPWIGVVSPISPGTHTFPWVT
jgi:hypothetical protein